MFVYVLTRKNSEFEIPVILEVYKNEPSYYDLYEVIINETEQEVSNTHLMAIFSLKSNITGSSTPSELVPVTVGRDTYYLSAQRFYHNEWLKGWTVNGKQQNTYLAHALWKCNCWGHWTYSSGSR